MSLDRLLLPGGLVLGFGGILLADHGPDYGIPRVIGDLCFIAGGLGLTLYEGFPKNVWPALVGGWGMIIVGLVLNGGDLLHQGPINIGDGCFLGGLLLIIGLTLWKTLWKERKAKERRL